MKSNPVRFNSPQTAAGLEQSSPQESPRAKHRNCVLYKAAAGGI